MLLNFRQTPVSIKIRFETFERFVFCPQISGDSHFIVVTFDTWFNIKVEKRLFLGGGVIS
jgi:hypothetical protein